jgi:hypothetical protein
MNTARHKRIFVFGSNLAGIHGAGSALEAFRNHKAVRGVGIGPTGNAYAIPTKDQKFNVLPLTRIEGYVERFKAYAKAHPELAFDVVAIGCGLAGYTPEQIAPMFKDITTNVNLPPEFVTVLQHLE